MTRPAKTRSHPGRRRAGELGYPAEDFAALIERADEEATPQPASACSALAQKNLGYVYVGTSYAQLPSYFGKLSAEAIGGDC